MHLLQCFLLNIFQKPKNFPASLGSCDQLIKSAKELINTIRLCTEHGLLYCGLETRVGKPKTTVNKPTHTQKQNRRHSSTDLI